MTGKIGSASQIKFIYIVTTLFLVGLSVYSFMQFNGLFKTSRLLHQTHEVIGTLDAISLALLDAESNMRGFALTGDSSLLKRKDQALTNVLESRATLGKLLRNDLQLMEQAISFNHAVDEKIRSIQNYEPSGPIINLVQIDEEIRKTENVNLGLDILAKEEASLLHQRTQLLSRLSMMAPFHIILLFLGVLLILFYSYYRVFAALAKSQDLHETLIQESKSKELLAAELTQTIQILAYQNEEKEKRASELVIANQELGFQNTEKEKRAAELVAANKELQLFLNISSHDLQEPLRKIQMAASRIENEDYMALSPKGRSHFKRMQEGALSMQTLIEDLLTYARTNTKESKFEEVNVEAVVYEILKDFKEVISSANASVQVAANCNVCVIPFQFRQMLHNIISNALKFSIPDQPPRILVSAQHKMGHECQSAILMQDQEYCHIQIADNGIGFEPKYQEKIFEVFQRLTGQETYKGTGMGLAIVKRIAENHKGIVTATGRLNEGATFNIYLPTTISSPYA